jgi:hypothetical protein
MAAREKNGMEPLPDDISPMEMNIDPVTKTITGL